MAKKKNAPKPRMPAAYSMAATPTVKYDVEAFAVLAFDGEFNRVTIGQKSGGVPYSDAPDTYLAFPLISTIPPRLAAGYRWWARTTAPTSSELDDYADEFLSTVLTTAYSRSSSVSALLGHEWHGDGWASGGAASPFVAQSYVLFKDGLPMSITVRPVTPGGTTAQTAIGRFFLVLQFKP